MRKTGICPSPFYIRPRSLYAYTAGGMRRTSIHLSLFNRMCPAGVETGGMVRRTILYLSLLTCLLLFPLLVACNQVSSGTLYQHILQEPTAIPATSLEKVDWSNFTYTFTCYTAQPVTITLHNGSAQRNGITYSVLKPVFGDLTGNGQPEAVLIFQCTAADAAPARVFVYAGTARHPTLLAILPPDDHTHFGVRTASISQGILQLTGDGYARRDSPCCPSLKVITRYKWTGTHFDVLDAEASPLTPVQS